MITHSDIGDDEDLAREILVIASGIAPCVLTFAAESEPAKNAVAILRRVYKDTVARGPRFVKAQSIGPARVDYTDVASMFEGVPTQALRALCNAKPSGGVAVGSFPQERPVSRMWPERY